MHFETSPFLWLAVHGLTNGNAKFKSDERQMRGKMTKKVKDKGKQKKSIFDFWGIGKICKDGRGKDLV